MPFQKEIPLPTLHFSRGQELLVSGKNSNQLGKGVIKETSFFEINKKIAGWCSTPKQFLFYSFSRENGQPNSSAKCSDSKRDKLIHWLHFCPLKQGPATSQGGAKQPSIPWVRGRVNFVLGV